MQTDEDIRNKIVSEIKPLDIKDVFQSFPHIVLILEKNYKRLLGTDKKKIALLCIRSVCEFLNMNNEEIESIMVIAPYIIDSLVLMGNKASIIFSKKNKKCCLRLKK